ncbi:MAG: hypothetical protein KG012_18625 [Deltaproteobacteria bacterium]|nr:hypothetical protein [Deltaproteobacteria bacterium]
MIFHSSTVILHLTIVDGRKIWINSNFIEALGPSISVENATWIGMASGEEYHISESPKEILAQIPILKLF